MSEAGSDSSKMLRYCGIPFCKNFRGTTDENVAFFRVPRKGTRPRSVWMVNLSTNPGIRKSLENIQELCMLHFKPNNLESKMQNGKPIFTLKSGAAPLPIKIHNLKPMDTGKSGGVESSACGNGSAGANMQDVKFIDMNEFRGISSGVHVKSELIDEELQPSTLHKLDDSTECSGCIQLSIQSQDDNKKLQKAKMRIKELEKENVALKLKIQYLQRPTEKSFENVMETRENKMTTTVNVQDIKSKPKKTDEEIPIKIPTSSSIQKNPNSSKSVQSTTAVNRKKTIDHSEERNVSCKRCLESFPSVEKLVEHLKIVDSHRFECFICKRFKTLSEKIMRNHIKRHKQPRKSFCHICNKSFGWHQNKDLDEHLCGNEKDIQCEYCPERFTATKQLHEHLENMHKTNRNLYTCTKCPKIFAMSFFRDWHVTSHSKNSRMFECDMCSKKFIRKGHLSQHMNTHKNSQKSHLCEECGKTFSTAQILRAHKKSSIHSTPTFECKFCPKKFFHESHLRRHSGIHLGLNYACELCGRGFAALEHYRKHMKCHNQTEADRRHTCKQCPMKFFRPADLRNHEKKHLGIKQFHCRFCDQSYMYSYDLGKHLRTHYEDGKIHACSECDLRFKYLVELKKHSYEHYKEKKAVNGSQPDEDKTEDN